VNITKNVQEITKGLSLYALLLISKSQLKQIFCSK